MPFEEESKNRVRMTRRNVLLCMDACLSVESRGKRGENCHIVRESENEKEVFLCIDHMSSHLSTCMCVMVDFISLLVRVRICSKEDFTKRMKRRRESASVSSQVTDTAPKQHHQSPNFWAYTTGKKTKGNTA